MVPEMTRAQDITSTADILITVGTSLNVYPAANLVHAAPKSSQLLVVDPNEVNTDGLQNVVYYKDKAGVALPVIVEHLLANN